MPEIEGGVEEGVGDVHGRVSDKNRITSIEVWGVPRGSVLCPDAYGQIGNRGRVSVPLLLISMSWRIRCESGK